MSSYQLPCPECSESLTVTLAQAGDRLTCKHCETWVDVPTMREIRTLPVVETARDRRSGGWNVVRGSLFVTGALMIGFAALAHWRLEPQRRRLDTAKPEFQDITFSLDRVSLKDAWEAWNYFRFQDLDYRETPQFIENRRKHRELTYSLYTAWSAAGIGLTMIAGSIIWPAAMRR